MAHIPSGTAVVQRASLPACSYCHARHPARGIMPAGIVEQEACRSDLSFKILVAAEVDKANTQYQRPPYTSSELGQVVLFELTKKQFGPKV